MGNLTFLERRLMKLERLVYERSVGRGGPSIAMNMWTFLMDNGPSTIADIDAGLGSRYSNKPTIKSYLDAGLITKRGDTYVANPDYEWDDVGKIERPGLNIKDITAALDNGKIVSDEDLPDDIPERPQRQPRTRTVKANIFSRKFDEVKAAVDGGVDVNSRNASGKTALQYALMSDKPDTAKIVKYLLDHGASLDDYATGRPLIFEAIKNNNHEAAEALIEHGVDLIHSDYRNKTVYDCIAEYGYNGDLKPFAVYDKSVSGWFYDNLMNNMLSNAYRGELNEPKVLEFISKMMDLIIEKSPGNSFGYNFDDTLMSELIKNKNDVSKSVVMRKLTKAKLWSRAISYAISDYSKLYPVIEKAYKEKWKLVDCSKGLFNSTAITVGLSKYVSKVDSEMISEMLTPDEIVTASSSNSKFVYSLLHMVRLDEVTTQVAVKIFSSIAKSKIKLDKDCIDLVLYCLTSADTPDRDVTRTGCRVLSVALKNGSLILKSLRASQVRTIAACTNEYFIEFMVESGLGSKLASTSVAPNMSDECKKILKEHGFEIGAEDVDFDKEIVNSWDVRHIIDGIENDESDREFRSLLQSKPELLDDPIIVQIANDPEYRNNFTAKLVQRAIDDREASNPDSKPKYDF